MQTFILVINSGSSSLKFSLFDTDSRQVKASGMADKLGHQDAVVVVTNAGDKKSYPLQPATHEAAMHFIFNRLRETGLYNNLVAIGHRVVHGGERFKASARITDEVLAEIERCIPFAPLHNPSNLMGITVSMKAAPHLPQVAVFDTAFHSTLPRSAYLYAVPYEWYQKLGVRRYGFHGTSHRYVTQQAAALLNIPLSDSAFVSAHLGNGASAAAVLNGNSVDTTMGFTPLEGLVMGTRSGDIDPGLPPFIAETLGISDQEVVELLNKKSGLLGISGLSNDMRELEAASIKGHEGATMAIDVFVHRLARYIGALTVSLPRVDALIFTGGIGENAVLIREKVIDRLSSLGYQLDKDLNKKAISGTQGMITTGNSVKAMVINTNEELMIVIETMALL